MNSIEATQQRGQLLGSALKIRITNFPPFPPWDHSRFSHQLPPMETVPLELFILPPLFDLPSVSGACIAAVSLCTLYLPQSSLQIIETTDLSIAPPALKHGKHHWYRGYTAIKHFLARKNDIDSSLTREQKADLVAWESLIQDVGETLAVPHPPRSSCVDRANA